MGVLILAGPTGVGKSALAIELALKYNAVILSADAMTVYRGLNIGTAKPNTEELNQVPHFGIDLRDIDQEFSVADFGRLFDDLKKRYDRIIIAGGTQFYLSSLLCPIAAMPAADHELRQKIQAFDDPHGYLQTIDPELAQRLHQNDLVRIVRGIEVFLLTGRPMSEVQRDPPRRKPLQAPVIWMDRDNMRERIQERLRIMMENGYLDECKTIQQQGWDQHCKPLKAFAYRYLLDHLRGEISLDEAIYKTEVGTWRLLRKQRIWARGLGWQAIPVKEAREKGDKIFSR